MFNGGSIPAQPSYTKGPSFELFPQLAKPRGKAFGALALGLGALALGLGALALGLGALALGLGTLICGLGAKTLGLPCFHEFDVSQKGLSIGRDDSQSV